MPANQLLQQTAAAILVPRDIKALSAAAAAELCRSAARGADPMGRYDGPHFAVDDEKIVSIWAATVSWNDIPEDYWTYNFDGGDADPWNRFSTDFGFGYYDDDFVESYFDDPEKKRVPIGDLISPLSYASSFADEVMKRAKVLGIEKTSYVFLMYNFKYDPKITGKESSPYFRFVGAFPFIDD